MTMATLSDKGIVGAIKRGVLRIEPFEESSLSPAGYDLRAGEAYIIPPGNAKLIHTMERVELSSALCGQLFLRSSFAREGMVGSFALVDPGFRGQLTLAVHNLGEKEISIAKGERVAQLVLCRLENPAAKPYAGRYQDSIGPVGSKRNF